MNLRHQNFIKNRPETCGLPLRSKHYHPAPKHNMFIICKPMIQNDNTQAANRKNFSQSQPAILSTNQRTTRESRQLRSMTTIEKIRPPPCTPDLDASKRGFNRLVESLERGEKTSHEILRDFIEVRKDTHNIYIQRTNTFT